MTEISHRHAVAIAFIALAGYRECKIQTGDGKGGKGGGSGTNNGDKCDGKITDLYLEWTGTEEIIVSGQVTNATDGKVEPGDIILISQLSGDNDQQLVITGSMNGYSVFHISWYV